MAQAASSDAPSSSGQGRSSGSAGTVSREEVGRATWTFLHTLAAQYPEHPTRQQQRDAKNLVGVLGESWAADTEKARCVECRIPVVRG